MVAHCGEWSVYRRAEQSCLYGNCFRHIISQQACAEALVMQRQTVDSIYPRLLLEKIAGFHSRTCTEPTDCFIIYLTYSKYQFSIRGFYVLFFLILFFSVSVRIPSCSLIVFPPEMRFHTGHVCFAVSLQILGAAITHCAPQAEAP